MHMVEMKIQISVGQRQAENNNNKKKYTCEKEQLSIHFHIRTNKIHINTWRIELGPNA